MTNLMIVGAGPKAVAVAAKAHALREVGLDAPEVTVVEPHGIGANWRAVGGWTDGKHLLGTPPAKDIGFPYRSEIAGTLGPAVDQRLLANGWVQYLIESGRYSEWIDRGNPCPRHDLWADYLEWVAGRVGMDVIAGTVTRASRHPGDPAAWSVSIDEVGGGTRTMSADALMITGPGRSDRRFAEIPGVLSVAAFWEAVVAGSLPDAARVSVIGGGETAASVIDELVRHDLEIIDVISPLAAIFSRGESQFENALYTDPRKWAMLDDDERRDVIRRTDRGVFSGRVQGSLHAEDRVHHVHGRVEKVNAAGDAGPALAVTVVDSRHSAQVLRTDLVIDARGNSPMWFAGLLGDDIVAELRVAAGGDLAVESVEAVIGRDLSVEGMTPKLFLPGLAGMAQGPGFANLSCLGELSDRVLGGFPPASAQRALEARAEVKA
ncbi:SidA/IucD/PvdA family monooxygenase [Corynebacterium hansenii]|uniref:L-lysine N6-monooxygenase MbtG n=1 Tax=Corynebacterium hansenii TaxID=394964 RepID=A0ABV7ZT63_9CORY|nr:SidA/IucD/PvdA family monooxygenase [Corynebacterium hansenii]WJY99649.1 hypothetical protein CHAN_05135 [Corynebacterium hansenii]